MTSLTPAIAAQFAALTLGHLGRQWPYKLDHVMTGPEDVQSPIALHPIFHGSFDWHSCVHGWWQVMRLLRRFPDLPQAAEIRGRADAMLSPGKVAGELSYLGRPGSAGFERPYGWGWLLALHLELSLHEDPRWADALDPLARAFAARFHDFLPRLTYPIRVGAHPNSSFAMLLARRWAERHDPALAALIAARATAWFGADRGCQAWEPGGDEFLSPALTEAHLIRHILSPAAFVAWFDAFLPHIPETLLTPAFVSDRTDGKIAHLDGLNLSRAWCWRGIADGLPAGHPVAPLAEAAFDRHLSSALPHLADHYMGEHWLASFALLALDGI
ncbi:DUF2891 domain-containing protein [Sphingomonas sp. SRS2]|uniref:DUF2891 domain-containing protein n=1 Tax=Sphingomonas sp. SRS2 TaxID=133190 RepID=UPI0006183EDF|nr:DUF2891 domain-containing protein [Sphingomonas sp. SRS2]KKC26202.1 hypothetical protein WP12_09975 [Sphingomonas sp. SRS2]